MGDTITQIGRYEISRQLVDTALASVYDAFDPVDRKPVTIRIPRTKQHGTAALTPWLRHPGLMNVLSYEQSHGEPFVVLEPFQGTSLDSLIQSDCKREPAEALELLRQLASVLDYAHANGSLHGSLHPASILLNDRNQVKVLDLGAAGDSGRNADPQQLLRAIHYLSPECVCDQPMDGRSDQFSLAVLAHALVTGVLPFSGKPLGVMFRIAYQKLERDAIRELPPAAQTALQRALSKRPTDRYATCSEMVEAFASAMLRPVPAATRMVDAQEFTATRPPAPAPVNQSWTRHFSGEALRYFGVTFVLIALVLAGLLYFLLPKAKPTPAVAPAGVSPAAAAPQPVAAPPAVQPQPPAAPKATAKGRPKKKEPDVELKPVEPKIIRQ